MKNKQDQDKLFENYYCIHFPILRHFIHQFSLHFKDFFFVYKDTYDMLKSNQILSKYTSLCDMIFLKFEHKIH